MSQQKYPKAYEAYQQAVYRDGRNPTFWCSIGVLYYQINQYRDALDAYSRAIRLNPYISEVWYDLGTLYESCNNQITDALDAYQRAAELDPANPHIKARLQLLRSGSNNGGPPPAAPQPADVHPQAYQASGPQPAGPYGPSLQQSQANGPPHTPQGSAVGENWAGRLSNVNPPPQPPNPFNDRSDSYRGQSGQGGPGSQRQPTPQQDQQMRQGYPEPSRSAPSRRGQSPAPSGHQYGQHPPPPQPPMSTHPPSSDRVTNPNFAPAPSAHANGVSQANGGAPYRSNNSPRPDGRTPHENRIPSPKSAYPQHQPIYPPHPEMAQQGAPEGGLPPPPTAAAESSVQRSEERPGSAGPKRMREWEEEGSAKKQANEENRARLEDMRHRRPSTPPRDAYRRNSSEARHAEEQRRTDEQRRPEDLRHPEAYHPSEAAHHQTNHASGTQGHGQKSSVSAAGTPHEKPQSVMTPKEERAAPSEPSSATRPAPPAAEPERAARKMDVDEDYDDSGEDEKKAVLANGSGPSSATGDVKASPTTAGVNGSAATSTKTE
jgi:glucose repression mediator protein